jgi:hypothetical protein
LTTLSNDTGNINFPRYRLVFDSKYTLAVGSLISATSHWGASATRGKLSYHIDLVGQGDLVNSPRSHSFSFQMYHLYAKASCSLQTRFSHIWLKVCCKKKVSWNEGLHVGPNWAQGSGQTNHNSDDPYHRTSSRADNFTIKFLRRKSQGEMPLGR